MAMSLTAPVSAVSARLRSWLIWCFSPSSTRYRVPWPSVSLRQVQGPLGHSVAARLSVSAVASVGDFPSHSLLEHVGQR